MLEEKATDEVIPSFPHVLANNPAILEATSPQFFEVRYGEELEPDLKQLAFVIVSQENECQYCVAAHGSELLHDFVLPDTYLDAIADRDYAQLTDRERTVAEFARQGATDPKRITEDHLADLRKVGVDEADVIELLAVVGIAAFTNTIADAMNIHPSDQSAEPEQFIRRIWSHRRTTLKAQRNRYLLDAIGELKPSWVDPDRHGFQNTQSDFKDIQINNR